MLARRPRIATVAPSAHTLGPSGALSLAGEFDRLVRDVFGAMPVFPSGAFESTDALAPAVNVWEDEASVHVEAELPGFAEQDIHVSFEKGALTLSGRRERETEQKGERFIRRERTTGEFTRSIGIETEIEPNGIEASLKNGVLLVRLPKTQAERARKIEVRRA